MATRTNPRDADASARRARYVLYAIGGVFAALGFTLEMVPALAATTPWWSGRACALIGVVFLSIGRFASDRFVRRCESLLTGWP
jgi:hypothetical protein